MKKIHNSNLGLPYACAHAQVYVHPHTYLLMCTHAQTHITHTHVNGNKKMW